MTCSNSDVLLSTTSFPVTRKYIRNWALADMSLSNRVSYVAVYSLGFHASICFQVALPKGVIDIGAFMSGFGTGSFFGLGEVYLVAVSMQVGRINTKVHVKIQVVLASQ